MNTIFLLKANSSSERNSVGRVAFDLVQLHRRGLPVLDTVVLTNEVCQQFLEQGSTPEAVISRVLELCSLWHFHEEPYLFFRYSLPQNYPGLVNRIKVKRNFTELKFAIERIFRSWSDSKAKSFRLVRNIDFSMSLPAVVVQPFCYRVWSLCTRDPKTGEYTNEVNYSKNIHNVIEHFSEDCAQWLKTVDGILCRPAKIYFIDKKNKSICSVTDQVLTPVAKSHVLKDYYELGSLGPVDFVTGVEAAALNIPQREFQYQRIASTTGIPRSEGSCLGKLVFTKTDLEAITPGKLILAISGHSVLDDCLISKCDAIIGSAETHSIHITILTKSLGIPFVICDDLLISNSEKKLYLVQSEEYSHVATEGSEVRVNGRTGEVIFYDPSIVTRHEHCDTQLPRIAVRMLEALDEIKPEVFNRLPMLEKAKILRVKRFLSGLDLPRNPGKPTRK